MAQMTSLVILCKRDLLDIYKHALDAIKPDRLVTRAVSFRNNALAVQGARETAGSKPVVYPLGNKRLHVIGGGKCVLSMARGLAALANESQLTTSFGRGCLSVPVMARTGYESDSNLQTLLKSIGIDCRFGSKHNLPDEDSVDATRLVLDCIAEVCREDKERGAIPLFIVLISGGGSACLSSPKYISLGEKTNVIRELVKRGADIVELNRVRRYFSNVKGGNLARFIREQNPDAQIVSLIISDVVGDPIEFIASGPTFIESGENKLSSSMEKIMQKYCLEIPTTKVEDERDELRAPGSDTSWVMNKVIGNNVIALQAAAERATALNYAVRLLGTNMAGDTGVILKNILANHSEEGSRKSLTICGGETTVKKQEGEAWGLGGRVQEMALDYIIAKLTEQMTNDEKFADVFLAGSTDGQDGPTDVAACLASHADWLLDRRFCLEDALAAKRAHDSYRFWNERKPDWLLRLGPTGTNVMDLYFLATITSTEN